MKRSDGGADDSFGPPLGQRPVWDTNGPDLECDCPGPPPLFHLPPPPKPPSLSTLSECSSASPSETCKALTVIDSGYRYSPAIPSGTIILVTAVAVAVFVFIGTFLVLLKKRRMSSVFGGKASLRNRCDRTSANGVIYEDLPNIRPRTLSPGCPLGQTRLPSIEMIDVTAYTDPLPFTPALIAPPPPPLDPCDAQDMFNPVYEELSNGSGEQPDSNSEDDFAEDELSLGGEGDHRSRRSAGGFLRDVDSDADDRSKFLGELPRRTCRGGARRAKTLDRRKVRASRTPPPLFAPPAECTELSQGFLLRRILQMYPDVTGVSLEFPRGGSGLGIPSEPPLEGGDYESLPRPRPDIFSTLEKSCVKREGQDSGPGSDSGYSNNTSGGRMAGVGRGQWPVGDVGGAMLSSPRC